MNTLFLKFLSGMLFVLLFHSATISQEATLSKTVTEEMKKNTHLLGDNFNLYSALEALQRSETMEQFQNALNTEPWSINNLDLNKDKKVDYITVHDITDEGVHNIVISAHISKEEQQDIAVIEVVKSGTEKAILQIVGHEEFYGKNMVIEPFGVISKGENGAQRVLVNVWNWPVVKSVFASDYKPFRSSQGWGRNHRGYKPWAPKSRKTWSSKADMFSKNYYITPVRRAENAVAIYEPYRLSSTLFEEQNQEIIALARNTSVDVSDVDVAVAEGMVNRKNGPIEYINSEGRVMRIGGEQIRPNSEGTPPGSMRPETPAERNKRLKELKARKEKKKKN